MKHEDELDSVKRLPFGELLKSLRQRCDLSQAELAMHLGLHRNTIGKWERGDCLPDTRGMVLELANRLALNERETNLLLQSALFASETASLWQIPMARNFFFTGRVLLLEQLHALLSHEHQAVLSQAVVLSGFGGVGKTQTALEYAYRHAQDYSALFWVHAETSESILASISAIAYTLNLPEKDEANQKVLVNAVSRWLNSHQHWLLIVDNVDDLSLIKQFFPASPHGSFLFTTRQQMLGTIARPFVLERMTEEEGAIFLLRRARRLAVDRAIHQAPPDEVALACQLVERLNGLPLAIDQAGAYIEETQCGLGEYLELYQRLPLALLSKREAYADHPDSVARTVLLTFEQIQRRSVEAAALLQMCAFLGPDALPEAFFLQESATLLGPTFTDLASDPLRYHAVLKELSTYSLIRRNVQDQTLSIHRLVQVVLKASLTEEEQQQRSRHLVETLDRALPAGHPGSLVRLSKEEWAWASQLLPHVLTLISFTEQWHFAFAEMASLLVKTAHYLFLRARYTEVEPLLQRALLLYEQIVGPEQLDSATCYESLGSLYAALGKYTEAERCYQHALILRKRLLSPEHPDVAETYNSLAVLYEALGKCTEAEALFREATHILERALGPEHLQVAIPLFNLAGAYQEQNRYEEAELIYLRVRRIYEQDIPEQYLTPPLLHNLACLYEELGRYAEAEPLYQQALHLWERIYSPEHPLVAYAVTGLADLYQKQGRTEEAEALYRRSIHIREQALSPEHPEVGFSLRGLAELCQKQGRMVEAEALYHRALHIWAQTASDHPEASYLCQDLAELYQAQGKDAEAEPLYQRALQIGVSVLGPDHPRTREIKARYARFQIDTGRVDRPAFLET